MMKHKSILIILLVIALVFTVAACSGPSKEAKAVTKARAASDPFVEKLENQRLRLNRIISNSWS